MKKNGQQSGFRTAAVIGLLAASGVMARPVGGRVSREAVALDEVVLVSKVSHSRADKNTAGKTSNPPISGTLLGMLGGMMGQGDQTPPEDPGVIISDALGDDGGDIEGVLFGVNFLGGLFFGEP